MSSSQKAGTYLLKWSFLPHYNSEIWHLWLISRDGTSDHTKGISETFILSFSMSYRFTRSLIDLLAHLLTHLIAHSLTHQWCTNSLIHLPTHSLSNRLIHSTQSPCRRKEGKVKRKHIEGKYIYNFLMY